MNSTLDSRSAFTKRASAHGGSYWTTEMPKKTLRTNMQKYARAGTHAKSAWWDDTEKLSQYLTDLNPSTFAKTAAIGGEQEQGFEQAFASLAYVYLKDKSPRLLDYIAGFQLVDRNEDNTKAMGLFGFKVGDQWFYAPMFFLNGDMKGHEMLYDKKQNMFLPMKENWVNYLISHKPHSLGEPSERDTNHLGGLFPDVRRMAQPYTKLGSVQPDVAPWAAAALPTFFAMATKQANALFAGRDGELNFDVIVDRPFAAAFAPADRFDLRAFLTELPLLKVAYEKMYKAYPLIKQGVDAFYGESLFLDQARKIRMRDNSVVKRAESFIVPPKKKEEESDGPLSKVLALFDSKPEKEEKKGGLWIYTAELDGPATKTAETAAVDKDAPGGFKQNKPDLDDDDRAKLLRDTVLIKDTRNKASIAYNTQVTTELCNPAETGVYRVLEKPGTFADMVVISSPHTGRGNEDFCTVLRKDSPKNWKNVHRTELWADQRSDAPTPSDWKKFVEGLSGLDSLSKGGTYVAVHENGEATAPFRVEDSYGDGVYDVNWLDSCSSRSPIKATKAERSYDWEIGYSSWRARVYINERKGSKLISLNGEVHIPTSFKLIKIADPPKPKKTDIVSCCLSSAPSPPIDGSGSADEPINPGNLIDVQLLLHKQASEMKIHDTGAVVAVKAKNGLTQYTTKLAALVGLVRDHGLREEQARIMLKTAESQRVHNRAVSYLIKYADGYMGAGPSAPAFPAPQYGNEPLGPYKSVRSIYPQEEEHMVPELMAQNTDPMTYDPFYVPDQAVMQVAQQAAASGQKEVFDTSMISGMLKAVRQDALVDRYLGDLMKALDKLGRILFMFYWHQEEFEDRYGKQDLPELEDSLRNAFEVLGDVVLFLKEKTVGGGPGAINTSGIGAADAGEPDIREAARN